MNRRNILEQAYSYAHAKSSGIWHIKDRSAANDTDGVQLRTVSDAEIFREMALVLDQECYLETYFLENAMEPYRIDYEAFCASRVSLFAELLGFIGIDHTTISGHLARLGGLYKKMPYDRYRDERLLDFRTKYSKQVAYLMRARGRLPYHSLRNFVLAQSGIDIATKPPQKA